MPRAWYPGSMQKEAVRQWYDQMWNLWDESVFEQILDREIELRGSLGQVHHGYTGVAEYMRFVRTAFRDFRNQIEDLVEEQNRVFARLTYTGTHNGELFGIPPTGRRVEYAGAALFTFRDERIVKVWVLGDVDHLKRQLSDSPSRPKTVYMVVEHFKKKDAAAVYRRFRDCGRMTPEGLIYVSSWVDEKLERCYQLMETHDRKLLDEWMARWNDLVDFEVHPVITSKEAAGKIAPQP
ncbi:MAG: ester cyclase [Acidobacteriaceae bacterium]|nr:ester cyclase [Acidobacteriaceae bacterium]